MENPVLPDDSDEKWDGYHGHTRAKHELLHYYLDPWIKTLGSTGEKIRIFDCFAGRGDYLGESTADPVDLQFISSPAKVPGSPQIILDRTVQFSDITSEIECVFIEKTDKNAEMLQENLPPTSHLPDNVSYDIVPGRFQDKTESEISKRGGWDLPTFLFVDPYGYKQVEYELITKLASQDRFELLINLMASEVIRWQDVDKHQDALKRPFGTPSWREEMEQFESSNLDHDEVGYYCERLKENGPKETLAYLVTEEDSKSMKYYLVFCTNSTKGLEIMRDAMQKCGPGKFAYAPMRPDISKDQTGLSQFSGKNDMRNKLLELFSSEEVTFNDIVSGYVEFETYSTYRRKHIRDELKKMEQEGIIEVERVTSKTQRGLGKDDVVKFTST